MLYSWLGATLDYLSEAISLLQEGYEVTCLFSLLDDGLVFLVNRVELLLPIQP